MCRFLVADDDPSLRGLLCTLLGVEAGWSVVAQAGDGREAIRLVRSGVPADVAILDLNMPHMEGRDLVRELHAVSPPLDVVVYSGEDECVARKRVDSCDDFAYVVKGRPEELLDALHELCARRQCPGRREQQHRSHAT